MTLLEFVLGFLIASSIYDLIKFFSKVISHRVYFNKIIYQMQKEVDDIRAQQCGQVLFNPDQPNDDSIEIPVHIIKPKVTNH